MSDPLPPLPGPWECGLCGAPPAYTAEHLRDYARSAIEAALAAAPACPHIRSSGPPERATNWCALAAAPQAEPVAWAQKAALDGVREYGEIIATLYADGYQPEQEWTEPLYAAPPQRKPQAEPVAKVELMMTGGNAGLATRIVEIDDHLRERLRPGQLLYAAPPAPDALREAARMAHKRVLIALDEPKQTMSDGKALREIVRQLRLMDAELREALGDEK